MLSFLEIRWSRISINFSEHSSNDLHRLDNILGLDLALKTLEKDDIFGCLSTMAPKFRDSLSKVPPSPRTCLWQSKHKRMTIVEMLCHFVSSERSVESDERRRYGSRIDPTLSMAYSGRLNLVRFLEKFQI